MLVKEEVIFKSESQWKETTSAIFDALSMVYGLGLQTSNPLKLRVLGSEVEFARSFI